MNWEPAPWGLISLSYWAPSPGNFLASIVLELGLDMRIKRDVLKVLRVILDSSIDELLHIVPPVDKASYGKMSAETLATIRSRAIDMATSCLQGAA